MATSILVVPELTRFCFCCELRPGACIIAAMSMFGTITNIGFTILCLHNKEYEQTRVIVNSVLLALFVVYLIITFGLVYGIHKESKFWVMIWFRAAVVMLVLRMLDLMMMMKYWVTPKIAEGLGIDWGVLLVLLAFGVYCVLVVRSYAKDIEKKKGEKSCTQPSDEWEPLRE